MEEGSGEKSTLWGLPTWMVVVGGLLVMVILYVLYRDYEASKTTGATDISTASGTTTSTGTGTGTTTINPVVYEVGSGAAVAGQTTSSTTNTPVGSNSPTNTPSTPTGTLTPEPVLFTASPPSATVTSPTGLITEGEPVSTPIANPVETTTGTAEPSTEVSNAASSQKVVKTSTEAANQVTSGIHNALSPVAASQTQSQMSADILSANASHPVLSLATTSTLQAEGILPSSSASNFYSSEQNYVRTFQAGESQMTPEAKKMQVEATSAKLAAENIAKIDAALGETAVRG